MTRSDTLLVGDVAAGDRGAFEDLYYSVYPELASFLRRLVGHRNGVQDIIDESFVEAWKSAKNFREASPAISMWIFGIAYRKTREHLCGQSSPGAWAGAQRPFEQFIDALNDDGIGDEVMQDLGVLPFEQRCTLLLAYQMGYAREEIAAITGVPVGTVNARTRRARETLRSLQTTVSEAADAD
jgi:RNA polymerase sigma-70 factor (ECF subfamily)